MASKRSSVAKKPLATKQPLVEVDIKKKKKRSKNTMKSQAAKALLDQYGLCPISMELMRRPVLPSSGQAFDEINIVRYCSSGNRRCPVSGATLKFTKGKVTHTVDFALRNLIRGQAAHAKISLPSIDKDALLRELRTSFTPETAKAVVDDCYLGYIDFEELSDLLDEFSAGRNENGKEEMVTAAFCALLAECLACRRPDIVNLAVDFIEVYDSAWNDSRVLNEALAVAQDPDCRGQILVVLEEKVRSQKYEAGHVRTVLSFETESVPVQQFQASIAQRVIEHSEKGIFVPGTGFEAIINLALRVREDLDGCAEGDVSVYDVWLSALTALRALDATMDDATLERLFWRENCMTLQHLAAAHEELLKWHLSQHKQALSLCISVIGGNASSPDDNLYTSDEEEYPTSEEDEPPLPLLGYDHVEAVSHGGFGMGSGRGRSSLV